MSRFDDRLTKELERAARPAEPAGAFDEIDRRRGRRVAVRRLQATMLAAVVFAGSIGGVLVLNRAFRGDGTTLPAGSVPTNGPIVVSFGDDGGTHLYLQEPDDPRWDPRDHQLTAAPEVAHDIHPTVSPDGRTVVFVRYDPATLGTSLWSVAIDGTDAHRISPERAFAPAFAPDGATIAATGAGRPEDGGILLMDPDGTDVRTVPNTDSSMQGVAWSPDGSRLAVDRHDERYAVDLIGVDGSERTHLPGTESNTQTQPAWSPDGRTIAFVRDRDIWLYDLASQTARQLTTFPEPDGGDLSPTWSPDGRYVAFERYFSPSERFVHVVAPDGSGARRVGLGGTPAWGVAQREASPTEAPPTQTTASEQQGSGEDIGLGFELCRLQALNGIDFLGDGTRGAAWVGTRLPERGSCPSESQGESVVAVDVDGDGSAESWAGPLARCVGCSPFSVTDLNGDGVLELVVTLQWGRVTEYTLFSLRPEGANGMLRLRPVTFAEPGDPPEFRAGKPVSLWAGGDEGYSAWVRCENYPTDPVLIVTTSLRAIDAPDPAEIVRARLVLGTDGTIAVEGVERFTEPAAAEPSTAAFTGRACGVAFWPRA